MNKICTSIEQSKQLIKLGIDISTADMFWRYFKKDSRKRYYVGTMDDDDFNEKSDDVPAWSLSALLDYLCSIDMFPSIENDNNQFELTLSYVEKNKERPINVIKTIIIKNKELIDACVKLIIKLNEKKLL